MDSKFLQTIKHSSLRNYVLPGVTSSLIGGAPGAGQVRLFEASRIQEEHVTPHSHRFDFQCLVLEGWVKNILYVPAPEYFDFYEEQELLFGGKPGLYRTEGIGRNFFKKEEKRYDQGEWYGMKSDEIHSIEFSQHAVVLFFEGPEVTNKTIILQPVVDGEVCQTFRVADWMFKKAKEPSQ